MSLFRGTLRPPAILSDEAVERYLTAIREELAPDPLFRRRLRGEVMNRYVAAREGTAGAVPQRRSMGKLGRAVLYASFTIALSTTSVLAASQVALPGDALYPLKRHVESLRMEVLPAYLHHDLAAYELAERIDELARLTELGDVDRVAAMASVVADDYEAFIAESDGVGVESEDRYLGVLTAQLERLPKTAQEAVQAVIGRGASQGNGSNKGSPPDHGAAGSGNGPGQNSSSGAGAGVPGVANGNDNGPKGPSAVEPTPKPSKSPKAQPAPRASSAPHPASTDAPGADGPSDNAGGGNNGQDEDDDQ